MVDIICRDESFLVKGSFFMGMAGTYINESFEDENITVSSTLDEILEELEDGDSFWFKPLFPYLKGKTADGAGLLECAYDEFDENFASGDWHSH